MPRFQGQELSTYELLQLLQSSLHLREFGDRRSCYSRRRDVHSILWVGAKGKQWSDWVVQQHTCSPDGTHVSRIDKTKKGAQSSFQLRMTGRKHFENLHRSGKRAMVIH